jgi:Protein of unknown function (DUF3025).
VLSPRLADPIFDTLRPFLEKLPQDRWPTLDELNALAEGVTTASGMPLRFVPPTPVLPQGGGGKFRHYEERIARTGEVETRPDSWHDLFNALQWIAFPKSKARLNAQHAAILEEGGEEEARHRSPARDALTLFDEGGVIVASSAPGLLRLVSDFEWKALFWERRAEVIARMRFIPFGHGLHEQALAPYIGMVAKTVFIPVTDFFFMLSGESQREEADRMVAAHFESRARFASAKALPPLPVLGVPGWHGDTQDEAFYDIASYFRSKPRAANV